MELKAGERREFKNDTIEYGIVEKLSIQGDFLYAIIRREGTVHANEAGKLVRSNTELLGANGTPEQMLTLAEVLIPTDIIPGMVNMKIDFFIGRKVEVITNSGIPRIALLSRSSSSSPSRKMLISDITNVRTTSTNRELTSGGREILKGKGYKDEQLSSVTKEKYIDISTGPDILSYGVEQTWDIDLQKDSKNKERKDMSKISNFKYVSGLKGKPQKSKTCYLPILSIGGKT